MTDWMSQIRIGWLMIAEWSLDKLEWWHDKLTEMEERIEELFLCPGYFAGYSK